MRLITIRTNDAQADAIIAWIKASNLQGVEIEQIELPTDPIPSANDKLTHEQLMALPQDERMEYYDKHGGVAAVAKEHGYALSSETVEAWLEWKELCRKRQIEKRNRLKKDLYGK